MTTATAETALRRFLELMDAEDWERLVAMLAEDVELADELTATWLRGRDRVSGYLRAQTGVVTEISSKPTEVATRSLGDEDILVTFNLRQLYRLDGVERRESLTGCAAFRIADEIPLLTLFHLGEAASAEPASDHGTANSEPEPASLGDRIRARRESAALSLRALAATSGLSASFLSQVERSQVDASVSSLRRIAAALGTSPTDLLGDDADGVRTVRTGRFHERARTALHELGMTLETFPGLAAGQLQSWITELALDAPTFEARAAPGTERFVYVLNGSLAVITDATTLLEAGDGVHLAADIPYRLTARGNTGARFLSVQVKEPQR